MSDVTEGLPRDLVCPGCFKAVPSERTVCGACGEGVWVDGKLVLVGVLDEGRTAAFRGLLRGEDGKLEDVAVKVLDVGGLPNWREYERFRRQTEILASLKHPRIPQARGDFETKGRVLHCQTRVAGRNLARQLRGARLSSDEATRLADELLELIDYLHDHDVIHRDIKPDNVIIDEKGAAHLIDFGGARRLHGPVAAKDDAKLEAEPTVVGTPGYMAPEQARGELVPQSDLYALGKLLLEGLGGAGPAGRLAVLLPQLVREDWRKRPASAAEALRVLRPGVARARSWWPYVAATSVAVVAIVVAVRHRGAPPPARVEAAEPVASAAPDGPSLEELAHATLAEWLIAQNARDMDKYGRLYAAEFQGVRRTPTGKTVQLDRTAWLAERARMYAKPVEVKADEVLITVEDGVAAIVTFTQRFRRGTFADHGTKRLTGKRFGAVMQWTAEEMLFSRPGWDEASYATQVPLTAADCRVSFDPGAGRNLVVLSKHEDYVEALRAAAKARKKKVGVEIVWGPDFEGLDSGFHVLAGATDDADKAQALATKLGGDVQEATLIEQPDYGISRLIARKPLVDVGGYEAGHVTVVNGTAYVVGRNKVHSFSLLADDLVEKNSLALPSGIRPVRLAEHKGAAMLLDNEGHWYQVGNESIDRAPTFDPDSSEGKTAAYPSVRFELEDGKSLIARRSGAEPLPWPVDALGVRIFKASDDRLVMLRGMELFVFAIGQPPRRLTKVCATVDTPEGAKLSAPPSISLGPVQLVTDRSGKLDVWTGNWGFITPVVNDVVGAKSVVECGEDEDEEVTAPMVPMFRQTSVSVQISAGCYVVGC